MPQYVALPRLETPVTSNENAILLYLQRTRQGLESIIVEVVEQTSILQNEDFVLTSLDLSITPNGKLLLTETGVLENIVGVNSVTVNVVDGGITYAKIQDVSADTLLGREGTDGTVQEISIGEGLSLESTTLSTHLGTRRVVDLDTERVILDTYSVVVSRYFLISGTLILDGDAALEIL